MLTKWLEEFCFLLYRLYVPCRDAIRDIQETYSPRYRAHLREQRRLVALWRPYAELTTDALQNAHDVCETLHIPTVDYSTEPMPTLREPSTSALRVTNWQSSDEDDIETLPGVHAMQWLCRYKPSEE